MNTCNNTSLKMKLVTKNKIKWQLLLSKRNRKKLVCHINVYSVFDDAIPRVRLTDRMCNVK